MIDFILGSVVGALTAWLSFFVAVYPFYKKQATENAMLRDAVDSWKSQVDYLESYLQDFDSWRGGANHVC